MLKVRVMPTLLFKDVGLVKGRQFVSDRRVGGALQAIRVYNMREVDELVFLDITATPDGRRPDFAQIDELADECFMPLAVGGGVTSLDDIRDLLWVGADKVVVNSGAIANPDLIREGAEHFGSQCIVVAIDVKPTGPGRWEVFSHCGQKPTGLDPVAWARQAEALGAGEIMLTAIDRDGMMEGYDLAVTRAVSDAVGIPVIASGGAGTYQHMAEAVTEGHAAAVAAASMFHFTEQTPKAAKQYLRDAGLRVRL